MQHFQMLEGPFVAEHNANYDGSCYTEPSSQYSMAMVSKCDLSNCSYFNFDNCDLDLTQ